MQSITASAGGMTNAGRPLVCAPTAQHPQNAKYAQKDAVSRWCRYTVTAMTMNTVCSMSASARRPQTMNEYVLSRIQPARYAVRSE